MRRRALLALPLLALGAGCDKKRDGDLTFALLGQSNMAGRAALDAEAKQADSRVLAFTKAGTWQPATDPLHWDMPKRVGVGPGIAFGKRMADATGATIRLVPGAKGNTSITDWRIGGSRRKGTPFETALARIRLSQEGTESRLAGLLWHQGENDAELGVLEGAYLADLVELIGRFRRMLHAPELPFVAGQLGEKVVRRWRGGRNVNGALAKLHKYVPHVAVVSAAGLKTKDRFHFDTASARELGARYAEAMLGLVPT